MKEHTKEALIDIWKAAVDAGDTGQARKAAANLLRTMDITPTTDPFKIIWYVGNTRYNLWPEGPRLEVVVGELAGYFTTIPTILDAIEGVTAGRYTPTEKSSDNNGGTTSYYDIPAGAKTLNDLIEYKNMPFWQGEIFKATYALAERANRATDGSSSELRELNKILYYAQRRINAINGSDAKPRISVRTIASLVEKD